MNNADGAIASLVLYNRVLSDSEIAELADVPVRENLALNKEATASSSYPGKPWTPDKAVDGVDLDSDSRWSSKRATGTSNEGTSDVGSKEQWLMVDLQDVYSLDTVFISWEAASATAYDIEGSEDGENWTTLKSVTGVNGGQDTHLFNEPNRVRYLRIYCREPKTARYGYSIYELQAFGEKAEAPVEEANKTLLKQAIAYADAISEDELSKVNELVRKAFEEALAEAKAVDENPAATQLEVNNAWLNLTEKIHMLNFTTDKTELLALIAQAKELNPDDYEDETAQAFREALAYAEEVANDPAALDEQSITEAISRLQAAMDALVRKETLDKVLLQMLVDMVKDTDLSAYTSTGQDEFKAALEEAQALLVEADSQDQINGSVARLHSAYMALRLKPSEEVLEELRGFQTMVLSLNLDLFTPAQANAINDLKVRVDEALGNPDLSAAEADVLQKDVQDMTRTINEVLDQKPTDENKKPVDEGKPADEKKDPAKQDKPSEEKTEAAVKPETTNKSVKTAALSGMAGFTAAFAAAGAALSTLFRRKNRR